MISGTTNCWYALHVRAGKEKYTARALQMRGYEEFLPLSTEWRRWSDRAKAVERPLFPGYVFYRLALMERLPVLTIATIVGIVGINKDPTPIASGEIANLRTLVRSGTVAHLHPYLEVGQRVRLEEGPMRGLTGILVTLKKHDKVIVFISLL